MADLVTVTAEQVNELSLNPSAQTESANDAHVQHANTYNVTDPATSQPADTEPMPEPTGDAPADQNQAGKFGRLAANAPNVTVSGRKYFDSADRKIDGVLTADKPPSSPKRFDKSGKPSVLLVEDVKVSQRVARAALSKARYRVDLATDGNNAVEKFQKEHYEVILMDIQLPKMNGIDATIKIREIEKEEKRPPTVIFGLTGSVTDDALKTYEAAGMNGCIAKGNVLTEAVKDALEQHEADPTKFVVARVAHT